MFRIQRLAFLLFFLAILPTRAQTFSNVVVPYSGNFARIATNQKFSFYKAGAGGNNVAYIMNIQPGSAINLYVTAKSATFTTTDTLNVNFFTTGNPNTTNCSNGGSYVDGWTAAVVTTFINGAVSGTAGQVAHFTFAAATTANATSGILNAAQVCVQVINNSTGGANDTLDIYAAFTPNALSTGGAAGGTSIVDCLGGLPSASLGSVTLPVICDNASTAGGGLLIGRGAAATIGGNVGTEIAIEDWNGPVSGPIAVAPCILTATTQCIIPGSSADFNGNGSILTTTGGHFYQITQTINTTTQIALFANTSQITAGIANACTVEVNVTGTVTGTTPTMNVYFQDSDNGGGNWADRISFTQFTSATRQIATVVTGSANVTPYAPTNGTLAAGTAIAGPIRTPMRFSLILGGTTPVFNSVRFTVTCT